jgi:hypothetical protein
VERVEDVAKIEALRASVSDLEAKRAALLVEAGQWKDKAKTRLNWLILVLCAAFGFAIRKPVITLISHYTKW